VRLGRDDIEGTGAFRLLLCGGLRQASNSLTASFLHDQAHRVDLIEKTELTTGSSEGGAISKHTAVEEGSVDVSNHRAYVSEGIGLLPLLCIVQEALESLWESSVVTLVTRVDLRELNQQRAR
jgi:hypothetical protein